MNLSRTFLKPDEPSLIQVAQYLVRRYRQGNVVEADRAIVVVPGARAGRRLVELLLEHTAAAGLGYWPPDVTTVGRLPELLYTPRRALASDWVQQLAWCHAVRQTDRESLERIIPPAAAADGPSTWNYQRWLHLGAMFCAHYRHLAADGYSFADVAEITSSDPSLADGERWHALAHIQETYLRLMDGFELWDMQTARLVAVRQNECSTDRDVILVGTVDLSQTVRAMLDQIRDHVTALIHAPQSWDDRFDPYGALIPETWQATTIDVPEARIHVVDGPADQAAAAATVLARYQGRYRADEVAIGVPDERLVAYLQRGLRQFSIRSRWGPGRSVRQSGPWQLLDAFADLIESGTTAAWGALLRHPDMHAWLTAGGVSSALLDEFDAYCMERVPCQLDGTWPDAEPPNALMRAYEMVTGVLKPFDKPDQPLSNWCGAIQDLLLSIYGNRDLDANQPAQVETWEACQAIQAELLALQAVPEPLDEAVAGIEALRMVLRASAEQLLGALPDREAIELLGWLDLLQDDAPATIVTSLNEGFVPTSVRNDAFLPNALRARLGMDDNARRYARDAYTLQMLLASRRELDVIVARRAADDEPLLPSRLLFATDEGRLAERAIRLLSSTVDRNAREGAPTSSCAAERTRFDIPRPVPLERPIEQLSATAVRAYMACPYRFYLSYVLKLCNSTDDVVELDALQFGRLLHEVMSLFGESRHRHARNPNTIAKALDDFLDRCVAERFGAMPLPAARVQVAQLRRRLRAFAEVQAERTRDGWRIEHVEVDPLPVPFDVDGQPMHLRGRIDRIDRHQDGRVAILDYKSSESGKSPEETHRYRGEWVDLQLPIYRHLARGLNIAGAVELGFVLISSDVDKVQFKMAEWSETDLVSADRKLADVIRSIREQKFWPPADVPDIHDDAFASICMTSIQELPDMD